MSSALHAAMPMLAWEPFLNRLENELEQRGDDASSVWRRHNLQQFRRLGWPTANMDAWKYMPMQNITNTAWHRRDLSQSAIDAALAALPKAYGPRLVFVDGHYVAAASCPHHDAPCIVEPLSVAWQKRTDQVNNYLQHTPTPTEPHLISLNTAMLDEGVWIELFESTNTRLLPIELIFIATPGDQHWMAHPRVVVIAHEKSRACIFEQHIALGNHAEAYFYNKAAHVWVKPAAQLDYHVLQHQGAAASHMSFIDATVLEEATFNSTYIGVGAALSRHAVCVKLQGAHATSNIVGLYAACQEQHADMQISVEHQAPHTKSQQYFKSILADKATGVFSSKAHVQPQAMKTYAQQLNNNLLLSKNALAYSQPHLEILTDDVKCTHGSTMGQLDESAQFYLQSRGFDLQQALITLTYAFAHDILTTLQPLDARTLCENIFKKWLNSLQLEKNS